MPFCLLNREVIFLVEGNNNSNIEETAVENHFSHGHRFRSNEDDFPQNRIREDDSHVLYEHNNVHYTHKSQPGKHHANRVKSSKNFFGGQCFMDRNTATGFIIDLKQRIWENRRIIVLLIAIFLIAFGIRGHLLRYNYLFEFDAFYHARMVQDLVTQGYVSSPDPLAYYQFGGAPSQQVSLYHVVSAWLYHLVALGRPFDKDLFMWTIQFFPVVFGSLISVLMYFLGKEIFNSKKVGLITAFVAAVTPAFAYRTMAGAQGDNSFGFIWFVLGFIFLVRATKTNEIDKNTLINSILAGIMFGAMSMSWDMYLLIPLIVIAYFFCGIFLISTKNDSLGRDVKKNYVLAFLIKIIITMGIFHIISYLYGENWVAGVLVYVGSAIHIESTVVSILTIVVGTVLILLNYFLILRLRKEVKNYFRVMVTLFLYCAILIMTYYFITVPDIVDRTNVGSMVGEESVGNKFFGTKYNNLIFFPCIAILLFPVGLYFFSKNESNDNSHAWTIFFFWIILTLFMAWYKLKFTFVFGLAIAPAAAIVAHLVFAGIKKFNFENSLEAKIMIITLFLALLLGVGASAKFFPDYVPYVDEHPEWREAQDWIINNTPKDAKLFNWWDQGHILTFLTERRVSTDNRNYDANANRAMAEFIITTDANRGYYIALKEIGADYIVLDSSMFSGVGSFQYYVDGYVDQRRAQKYYNGPLRILSCYDNNTDVINCGDAQISRKDWDSLSSKWKPIPDDFQNGTIPVYYYKSADELLVLNQEINNLNLTKVWTDSNEISEYYEKVYQKGGILILKVKK